MSHLDRRTFLASGGLLGYGLAVDGRRFLSADTGQDAGASGATPPRAEPLQRAGGPPGREPHMHHVDILHAIGEAGRLVPRGAEGLFPVAYSLQPTAYSLRRATGECVNLFFILHPSAFRLTLLPGRRLDAVAGRWEGCLTL